jgi:hypothetical protein
MRLYFIDEVKNQRNNQYFGVCCVHMEHGYYQSIHEKMIKIFERAEWNLDQYEFKGSYMFSSSRGDPQVSVEKRIEMVEQILDLDIAKKNSKLKIEFCFNASGDSEDNYLGLLTECFKKLPSPHNGLGKRLCGVFVDHHDGYDPQKIRDRVIYPAITRKEWILLEDVHVIGQWNKQQMGMTLCDILAYLSSWISLFPDPSTASEEIMNEENISEHDRRKYQRVIELLALVKKLNIRRID